jgi:hypothetical protein
MLLLAFNILIASQVGTNGSVWYGGRFGSAPFFPKDTHYVVDHSMKVRYAQELFDLIRKTSSQASDESEHYALVLYVRSGNHIAMIDFKGRCTIDGKNKALDVYAFLTQLCLRRKYFGGLGNRVLGTNVFYFNKIKIVNRLGEALPIISESGAVLGRCRPKQVTVLPDRIFGNVQFVLGKYRCESAYERSQIWHFQGKSAAHIRWVIIRSRRVSPVATVLNRMCIIE